MNSGPSGSCFFLIPVIRPPWPDELPRLADAFPGLKWTASLHLRVLVMPATAISPERLVGLAAVAEPASGATDTALFLRVRARLVDSPAIDALLAEAIALARGLGLRTLTTGQTAGPDPREPALRRAGFNANDEGKSWRIGLD
jgi:hypothetical protein